MLQEALGEYWCMWDGCQVVFVRCLFFDRVAVFLGYFFFRGQLGFAVLGGMTLHVDLTSGLKVEIFGPLRERVNTLLVTKKGREGKLTMRDPRTATMPPTPMDAKLPDNIS